MNFNIRCNENCFQNGIKLTTNGTVEVRNKKRHAPESASKSLLYGHFVKSATLTNDGHETKEVNSEDEAAALAADEKRHEKEKSITKFTDEELFKKCGGLTGHKAARHGHGLNGKLARIARQEALDLASYNIVSSDVQPPEPLPSTQDGDGCDNVEKKQKSKKKKNRDSEHEDDQALRTSAELVVDADAVSEEVHRKKKKVKKSRRTNGDDVDAVDVPVTTGETKIDVEYSEVDGGDVEICCEKRHKKKKRKTEDDVELTDISDKKEDDSLKSSHSSKKKKKSRQGSS